MAKQQSLFSKLSKLQSNENVKEANKRIVEKANAPKKSKTVVTRGSSSNNSIRKKLETLIPVLRQKLKDPHNKLKLEQDEAAFRAYMARVREQGIMGLDCEGTSKDVMLAKLVGICVYTYGEKAIYVPTHHTDYDGNELPNQISDEVIIDEFNKCIKAGTKIVYHFAKYDIRIILRNLNIFMPIHWDTQLAANFLNENENHQLKPLWNQYCSDDPDDEADTFSSLFENIPFNYIPLDIAYLYAAKDPLLTIELYDFQRQFLDPESDGCESRGLYDAGILHRNIETPLIPAIIRMEERGVDVSEPTAQQLNEKYGKLLEAAEQNIHLLINKEVGDIKKLSAEHRQLSFGQTVLLNSPKQLSVLFYDILGCSSVDRRNPRGTGEEVLVKLKERHADLGPLFDALLEYRGLAKLMSTYIVKLPAARYESTNRIHGSFNQYGAKTGRFSSSDPNLQNIPSKNKDIRKIFKATDGFVLLGGDFSQQEPRVLAHLCVMLFNDRKMLDAYLSGLDLYSDMASKIYNVPYEECKEFRPDGSKNPEGKHRRSSVKEILLGLMYGRQVKSVAENLGISVDEAQSIMDQFFDTYPAVKLVMEYYWNMVREYGYIVTVWGRKRRLPDYNLPRIQLMEMENRTVEIEDEALLDYYTYKWDNARTAKQRAAIKEEANNNGVWLVDNSSKIADCERQILNAVIQGTSADITKLAMLLLDRDERLRKLDYHMLLTVHDEIIGEVPQENALKAAAIVREIMLGSTAEKILTPMSVDMDITRVWYGEDITEELKAA